MAFKFQSWSPTPEKPEEKPKKSGYKFVSWTANESDEEIRLRQEREAQAIREREERRVAALAAVSRQAEAAPPPDMGSKPIPRYFSEAKKEPEPVDQSKPKESPLNRTSNWMFSDIFGGDGRREGRPSTDEPPADLARPPIVRQLSDGPRSAARDARGPEPEIPFTRLSDLARPPVVRNLSDGPRSATREATLDPFTLSASHRPAGPKERNPKALTAENVLSGPEHFDYKQEIDRSGEDQLSAFDLIGRAASNPKELAKYMPWLSGSVGAVAATETLAAAYRLKSGEGSEDDIARDRSTLEEYFAESEEIERRGTTWGYTVVNIMLGIPAFMIELGTTGGVARGARLAAEMTLESVMRMLPKFAEKGLEKKLKSAVITGAGEAVDVVSRMANKSMAPRILESIAKRAAPNATQGKEFDALERERQWNKALVSANEAGAPPPKREDYELPETPAEMTWRLDVPGAIKNGVTDMGIELFSEGMGKYFDLLGPAFSRAFAKIPGEQKVKAFKDSMIKFAKDKLRIEPNAGWSDKIARMLKAGNLNSVWAEVAEEYFAQPLREVMVDKRPGEETAPMIRLATGESTRPKLDPSKNYSLEDRADAASALPPRVEALKDLAVEMSQMLAAFMALPAAQALSGMAGGRRGDKPPAWLSDYSGRYYPHQPRNADGTPSRQSGFFPQPKTSETLYPKPTPLTEGMKAALKNIGFEPESIQGMDASQAAKVLEQQARDPKLDNPKAGRMLANGWRWSSTPKVAFKVEENPEMGGAPALKVLHSNGQKEVMYIGADGQLVREDDVSPTGTTQLWIPKTAGEQAEAKRLLGQLGLLGVSHEDVPIFMGEIAKLPTRRALGTRWSFDEQQAPLLNWEESSFFVHHGDVPFMITKQMESTLSSLGYDGETIGKMTPDEAHAIINKGAQTQPEAVAEETKAPPTAAETQKAKAPGGSPATAIKISDSDDVVPGNYYLVRPKRLVLDPKTYQYKSNADSAGVVAETRIDGPWNKHLAGTIIVQRLPDRTLPVVEGHHRADAADRLGVDYVLVYVLEDMSPEAARVVGATVNISNDKGTAIDAAKIIRSAGEEELVKGGVNKKAKLFRDGRALAQLSDPVFERIAESGSGITPEIGAAIGEANLSEAQQMALVKLIDKRQAKGGSLSRGVVTRLAEDVKDSEDVTQDNPAQPSIFGDEQAESSAIAKAELGEWLHKELGRRKTALGAVAKSGRAGIIEDAGVGSVDAGKAKQMRDQEAEGQAVVQRLSGRGGPINEALKAAAVRIVAGEKPEEVRHGLLKAARAAINQELGKPVSSPTTQGAQPRGDGEDQAGRQESQTELVGVPAAEDVATEAPKAQRGPQKLPAKLSKAAPSYGYRDAVYGPVFSNDIDRAAYITRNSGKRSKADAEFVDFVAKATGWTEDQVRAHGEKVKAVIKPMAQALHGQGVLAGDIMVPAQYVATQASQRKAAKQALTNEQYDAISQHVVETGDTSVIGIQKTLLVPETVARQALDRMASEGKLSNPDKKGSTTVAAPSKPKSKMTAEEVLEEALRRKAANAKAKEAPTAEAPAAEAPKKPNSAMSPKEVEEAEAKSGAEQSENAWHKRMYTEMLDGGIAYPGRALNTRAKIRKAGDREWYADITVNGDETVQGPYATEIEASTMTVYALMPHAPAGTITKKTMEMFHGDKTQQSEAKTPKAKSEKAKAPGKAITKAVKVAEAKAKRLKDKVAAIRAKQKPMAMIEPSYARTDSGRIQVTLGPDRAAGTRIMATSLYSSSSEKIIPKELIQNAFDAVFGQPDGKVSIVLSRTAVVVEDNGPGMTRAQLGTVFTDLFSSGKRSDSTASGGFGLAKGSFLLNGAKVTVVTTSEENGKITKHSFEATPEELMSEDGVAVKSEVMPSGTPTGTSIQTEFADAASDRYKADDQISSMLTDSTKLPAMVEFTTTARARAVTTKFSSAARQLEMSGWTSEVINSIPGADVVVTYDPKKTASKDVARLAILNNGLFQFETHVSTSNPKSWDTAPNLDIPLGGYVVDVLPTVEEGHDDYPFTASREALRDTFLPKMKQAIYERMFAPLAIKRVSLLKETYDSLDDVIVQDRFQPVYVLDSGARATADELKKMLSTPGMQKAISKTLAVLDEVVTRLLTPTQAATIERTGVLLHQRVAGIFIPNPSDTGKSTVLINPFDLLNVMEHPSGDVASGIFHTIVHEVVHYKARGHNETFTTELALAYLKLGGRFEIASVGKIMDAYGHGKYGDELNDDVAEALQVYIESRRRDVVKEDALSGTGHHVQRPSDVETAKGRDAGRAAGNRGRTPSVKDQVAFFDAADEAPRTSDIESLEEAWAAGVADFGDRAAVYSVQGAAGYYPYVTSLRKAADRLLGNSFYVYRLMSPEQAEEWRMTGDVGPVAVTLDPKRAEAFRKFVDIQGESDSRVYKILATPRSIVMAGKVGEGELVIDSTEVSGHQVEDYGDDNAPMAMIEPEVQTRTAAFKKWFRGSVLVGKDGDPTVLYHGTSDDIESFDLDHPNRKDSGWLGRGVYLTDSADLANSYSLLKKGQGGRRIMPLFARLENPYYADAADKHVLLVITTRRGAEAAKEYSEKWTKELIEAGHDGVILEYKAEDVGGKIAGTREIVVFSASQVKSAIGNSGEYSESDDSIMAMTEPQKDQTKTPEFRRWSGGVPVIDRDDASSYEGGPAVWEMLHGTVWDFDRFDVSKANVENDGGRGIHTTNQTDDANENYASEFGPDLKGKMERVRDRLIDGFSDDVSVRDSLRVIADDMGLSIPSEEALDDLEDEARDELIWSSTNTIMEVADELVRRNATSHRGMNMPVFVRTLNPAVVGGDQETVLTLDYGYEEDADGEDVEYTEPTGTVVDFAEAIQRVASQYDGDSQSLDLTMQEMLDYGDSLRLSKAIEIVKSHLSDYTDDSGDFVVGEIIREALQGMGFDGIVDFTVGSRFKNMRGVNQDTVHVIAFSGTQVKSSIGNRGTFEEGDKVLEMVDPAEAESAPLAMSEPASAAVDRKAAEERQKQLGAIEMVQAFLEEDVNNFPDMIAMFQDAYGDDARSMDDSIESAWEILTDETVSVEAVLGAAPAVAKAAENIAKKASTKERDAMANSKVGVGLHAALTVAELAEQEPGYASFIMEARLKNPRLQKVAAFLATDEVFLAARDARRIASDALLTDDLRKNFSLARMELTARGDGTIRVDGRGTRAWGKQLESMGARKDKNRKSWVLPSDQINALNEMVQEANDATNVRRPRRASYLSNSRIAAYRTAAEEIEDHSELEQSPDSYIGKQAVAVILSGVETGAISQVAADEQVEDAAKIARSYDKDESMFLLASEPGSGKTYVMGAAIAGMLRNGAKNVVYVTLRQSLIAQVKRDMKEFGIEDRVTFVTYDGLRTTPDSEIPKADVLIFDESQAIKNVAPGAKGAKRGKRATQWIRNAKFTVFASATPYENPVEAKYMEATGVFNELFGMHRNFALAFGATGKLSTKTDQRVGWVRTPTSNEDLAAAREWFRKRGIYAARRIRLPDEQVDSRMVKVGVSEDSASEYNSFTAAAVMLRSQLKGSARMWVSNFSKRLLEAAKVDSAIAEAEAALKRGRFPIIFVETKAERELDIPALVELEREYRTDRAIALREGHEMPKRSNYKVHPTDKTGLPPEGIVDVLEAHMVASGETKILIPGVEERVIEHFGEDMVAIYTGTITEGAAEQNLEEWREGKRKILIATMAKGGTGLSLHDKVGDHQTTQINLNLPWTGTGVVQVTQRSARYGLKGKAEIVWLFSDDIAFDRTLAKRVGGRMADMGAIVQGAPLKGADRIEDWDFEHTLFSSDETDEAIMEQMGITPVTPKAASTEEVQDITDGVMAMSSMFDEDDAPGPKDQRLPGDVGAVRDMEIADPKLSDAPRPSDLVMNMKVVTPEGLGTVKLISPREGKVWIRISRTSKERIYDLETATVQFRRVNDDTKPQRDARQPSLMDATPVDRTRPRATPPADGSKKDQRALFSTDGEPESGTLFMEEPREGTGAPRAPEPAQEAGDTKADAESAAEPDQMGTSKLEGTYFHELARRGGLASQWKESDEPLAESRALNMVRRIFAIDLVTDKGARKKLFDALLGPASQAYPMRNGRLETARALGTYHPFTGLIRLRDANDLETFMHEMGHMVDRRLTEEIKDRPDILLDANQELIQLGYRTSRPNSTDASLRKEGLAEFFRIWAANPEVAERLAKNYTEAWNAFMARNPTNAAQMLAAQQVIQRYLSQPLRVRGAARVSFADSFTERFNASRNEVKTRQRLNDDKRPWASIFMDAWTSLNDGKTTGEKARIDALRWETRIVDQYAMLQAAGLDMNRYIVQGDELVPDPNFRSDDPVPVDKNAWILNRLADKAGAAAEGFLEYGVRGEGREYLSDGFYDAVAKVPYKRKKDFSRYLVALRAIELHTDTKHKDVRYPGMSYEEALEIKAWMEKDPDAQIFKDARDGVYAYLQALVDYSVKHGYLTAQEGVDMKQYAFYVPLQRVMDGADAALSGNTKGDPYKGMKGSHLTLIDPLESIIRNTFSIVSAVERNRADAALVYQAEHSPMSGNWIEKVNAPIKATTFDLAQLAAEISKRAAAAGVNIEATGLSATQIFQGAVTAFTPSVFVSNGQRLLLVRINGERQFYEVINDELWETLKRRNAPSMDAFKSVMVQATMLLRAGATTRPSFILMNILRDTFVASMQSRHGLIPIWDMAKSLKSWATNDQFYKDFMTRGVSGASFLSNDRRKMTKKIRTSRMTRMGKATLVVTHPVQFLQRTSELFEKISRISEFRLALENPGGDRRVGVLGMAQRIGDALAKRIKTSDWNEADLIRATMAASDVTTDFTRGGTWVKDYNKYHAFLNARVQGYVRMKETFQRDPRGAMLTMALVGLASYLLMSANKDDETYWGLPDEVRRDNFVMNVGMPGHFLLIPKPFNWTFFSDIVEMGMVAEADHAHREWFLPELDDIRRAMGLRRTSFNEISSTKGHAAIGIPVAMSGSLLMQLLPTFFIPLIEMGSNYDRYRDRPIAPRDLDTPNRAADLQVQQWTSDTSRLLGALTGLSPAYLDHGIHGYAGGFTRDIFQLVTDPISRQWLARNRLEPPTQDWSRTVPGAGSVFVPSEFSTNGYYIKRFREDHSIMNSGLQNIEDHEAGEGTTDPVKEKAVFTALYPLKRQASLKSGYTEISKLQKEKNTAKLNDRLSADERQQKMKEYNWKIASEARKALGYSSLPRYRR